ncbi:hypothetical protein JG688_00015620 [Phytophthora aleatoria]|uniref:HTH CENPB-type domain-containing protein n=1 Tax=Phytophthora aleatoria TaxID=2496075 RepID=A0A8J5I5D1_9STRA|nr:hypothetical protein JG688_00015620 [Phytophthora aleatoria]
MARVKPKGRPRLGGRGRHVNQYKIQAESVGKKPSPAASSYQSKRARVLRWRREQSKLEEAASAHKEEHKKIREVGISTALSSDTEESIVVWVNELREEGVPVSTTMLTFKARELAYDANVKGFEASDKW